MLEKKETVELVGLPGSGKTTLAKKLSSEQGAEVVNIFSRKEHLKYLLLFLFSHPVSFIFWVLQVIKESNGLLRYKFHLWSLSAARSQKAKSSNKKVVIIDEGLMQRIFSVYDRKLNEREIKKVIRKIPLSDKVLFCEGGTFERFLEWERGSNSPRMKKGKEYFQQWREVSTKNAETLNNVLRSKFTDRFNSYNFSKTKPSDIFNR